MSTPVDLNPFPLGAVAGTSGTPLSVLTNFPTLAVTNAKILSVYAPTTNTGKVYVGRSNLNRATFAGVVLVIAPGQTQTMLYDISGGDTEPLGKYYVDWDTSGDLAVCVALFE